jgi:hypothetical protein
MSQVSYNIRINRELRAQKGKEKMPDTNNKITIQFNGKDVEVTQIQPGVVQKTA